MEELEELLYFFAIIWVIGVVLVFFDIRHQKKHPPKAPNPHFDKHLEP